MTHIAETSAHHDSTVGSNVTQRYRGKDRAQRLTYWLGQSAGGRVDAIGAIYDVIGAEVWAVTAAVGGREEVAREATLATFVQVARDSSHLQAMTDPASRILAHAQESAKRLRTARSA